MTVAIIIIIQFNYIPNQQKIKQIKSIHNARKKQKI